MERAGELTYNLLHIGQGLAVSGLSSLCVCLWRERLELVANSLPQSTHGYFSFLV